MSKILCASFPCSNFSTFFTDFLQTLHRHWYRRGVVWDCSGIISSRNNRVIALDLCPKCIFGQYLKNEYTNLNKILHMRRIDIGIGEEWYGIANGIISFRNNIVMAFDLCPKCIFVQYLKNEYTISIKFCICIGM